MLRFVVEAVLVEAVKLGIFPGAFSKLDMLIAGARCGGNGSVELGLSGLGIEELSGEVWPWKPWRQSVRVSQVEGGTLPTQCLMKPRITLLRRSNNRISGIDFISRSCPAVGLKSELQAQVLTGSRTGRRDFQPVQGAHFKPY